MYDVISMILAGGQGSRLSILAEHRAKPAVPFAGIYRIIDFTISNVMHSNIPIVGILTQYKPYSLMNHISTGQAWGFTGRKHQARILPPYIGEVDSDWYAGTADAIYQNLNFIDRFEPNLVVVLSGDHIYKMDYNEILDFHREKKADVTIAVQEVPFEDVHRFGVSVIDEDQRMVDFIEKKKDAPSNLASLGIYVFNRKFLDDILREDATDTESSHDFGKNIIPNIIQTNRVYCYLFKGYWRDVGTIDAYWRTHQEILDPGSGLDLAKWEIHTQINLDNLTNVLPFKVTSHARIHNSIISPGCVIEGEVRDSVLSPGVRIGPGAVVNQSIVMNNSDIREKAHVTHAILDKNAVIGKKSKVGDGKSIPNQLAPQLLSCGLTVFGKNAILPDGAKVGKNCLIYPDVMEEHYQSHTINSGETVKPPPVKKTNKRQKK